MALSYTYLDAQGMPHNAKIGVRHVAAAKSNGITLSALMAADNPDYDRASGSIVEQALNSQGVYLHDDATLGVRASTMSAALGETSLAAGAGAPIVSVTPSHSDGDDVIRRALFGEIILSLVEETITGRNAERTDAAIQRMIATRYSLPGGVFVQPKINSTAALDDEYEAPAVENTLPPQMVGITLSKQTMTIPSYSIGLEVTDKARQQVTLDMVALIVAQHAKMYFNRSVWRDINSIYNGNPMVSGEGVLPVVSATSLDASIGGVAGDLTDRAWFKFLSNPDDPYSRDVIICDEEAYLAILNRSGRVELPAGGYALHGLTVQTNPVILNYLNVGVPDVIIVPTGTIPANTIIAFDSSKAIAEVTDATAAYQAEESSVLRRNQGFRWDWSGLRYRLMGDAPFKTLFLG